MFCYCGYRVTPVIFLFLFRHYVKVKVKVLKWFDFMIFCVMCQPQLQPANGTLPLARVRGGGG